jgi:hypothetical protein
MSSAVLRPSLIHQGAGAIEGERATPVGGVIIGLGTPPRGRWDMPAPKPNLAGEGKDEDCWAARIG